jgi:leader peptidase (prepilin peptidase)/N-methyltransferase
MIVVMVIIFVVALGLCLGSFINALTWRIHMQAKAKNKSEKYSIAKGRSMCPHCGHELGAKDLIPLLSWVSVRGRCRYCRRPISGQYPLVELLTAVLFGISYAFWPYVGNGGWSGWEIAAFSAWLAVLTGLIALAVYDAKWYLLPDRIVFPLTAIGAFFIAFLALARDWHILTGAIAGVIVIAGLFYALFQLSQGKWIGGGDVKLGVLLGLLADGLLKAFLLLFLASILGTLYSFLLALRGKQTLSRSSRIPFGPFLIAGAFIVVLWGNDLVDWYSSFITGT